MFEHRLGMTAALALLGFSLAGCQTAPAPTLDLDNRGGWAEGTSRYCVTGQSRYSQLNAHAGWVETYAEEDYLLLGGHESTVGFWNESDANYTWAISEMRGSSFDYPLTITLGHHALAGGITCVDFPNHKI